ncbi:hypothetical protein H696_01228 [Fonticula alba]|uniref:Protein mago nashi n=1 Tax=Fonticula alba TaxID=691883 RepID=A0A058ZBK8_FONAL|nr:hypothetical protein H696_01228 [Fonticula alba]KCV71810.1 hypothetical protein H696_01228 [Fonticula alba]|eukprot:XP_009493388.1 hypothetical protein H696_01228 [Fonticula alba]
MSDHRRSRRPRHARASVGRPAAPRRGNIPPAAASAGAIQFPAVPVPLLLPSLRRPSRLVFSLPPARPSPTTMSSSDFAVQDGSAESSSSSETFYVRYFMGHNSRYGLEFMEFEVAGTSGRMRYVNQSKYRRDKIIRKEAYLSKASIQALQQIVAESDIVEEDDKLWPRPNNSGKQELEVVLDNKHISFSTSMITSMREIQDEKDFEGLQTYYYLIQELRSFMNAVISLHFKIIPY